MVRKSVVILLVALLSVGSASLRAQDKNAMSVYKVARFIQYLSNDYVDTINTSKIVEKAIVDMLGQQIRTLFTYQGKMFRRPMSLWKEILRV